MCYYKQDFGVIVVDWVVTMDAVHALVQAASSLKVSEDEKGA